MKFLGSALIALVVAASLPTHSEAFAITPSKLSALKTSHSSIVSRSAVSGRHKMPIAAAPQLSMSYSVAIVGATGAVGKEHAMGLQLFHVKRRGVRGHHGDLATALGQHAQDVFLDTKVISHHMELGRGLLAVALA